MKTYTKLIVGGTLVLLQACASGPSLDRLVDTDTVTRFREIGIRHLEKEYQDPSYLPPGYRKLNREQVEAVLVGKSFTLVNPANGFQVRAQLDSENQVIIRGRRGAYWSGNASWERFSWGDYHDRDKLCLTSQFCFVFSRFDDLEGDDILGARVHRGGKKLLKLNYRYWVFTNIDPINVPAD